MAEEPPMSIAERQEEIQASLAKLRSRANDHPHDVTKMHNLQGTVMDSVTRSILNEALWRENETDEYRVQKGVKRHMVTNKCRAVSFSQSKSKKTRFGLPAVTKKGRKVETPRQQEESRSEQLQEIGSPPSLLSPILRSSTPRIFGEETPIGRSDADGRRSPSPEIPLMAPDASSPAVVVPERKLSVSFKPHEKRTFVGHTASPKHRPRQGSLSGSFALDVSLTENEEGYHQLQTTYMGPTTREAVLASKFAEDPNHEPCDLKLERTLANRDELQVEFENSTEGLGGKLDTLSKRLDGWSPGKGRKGLGGIGNAVRSLVAMQRRDGSQTPREADRSQSGSNQSSPAKKVLSVKTDSPAKASLPTPQASRKRMTRKAHLTPQNKGAPPKSVKSKFGQRLPSAYDGENNDSAGKRINTPEPMLLRRNSSLILPTISSKRKTSFSTTVSDFSKTRNNLLELTASTSLADFPLPTAEDSAHFSKASALVTLKLGKQDVRARQHGVFSERIKLHMRVKEALANL